MDGIYSLITGNNFYFRSIFGDYFRKLFIMNFVNCIKNYKPLFSFNWQ